MTNVDFVMTIAIGTLLAGAAQATTWSAFGQALAAMSALSAAQYGLSRLRINSDTAEDTLQNQPALLMRDGEMIDAAMRRHRVTRSDLVEKLREANVLDLADIRAVVLETTGDISVLRGSETPAETLLRDVRTP
ncbi:MAG: YetF domain-containing protein [Pseudomonadota bacterium]